VHWECLLAKLSGIATHDSHYCSCLGHLGQCDTDRIVSIFCFTAQGGQGKYKCVAVMCHFAGVIVPTFADVNTALKLCTCTMSTDIYRYLWYFGVPIFWFKVIERWNGELTNGHLTKCFGSIFVPMSNIFKKSFFVAVSWSHTWKFHSLLQNFFILLFACTKIS